MSYTITPFEIFRTPIQILRFSQGFYLNGIWQEGSQAVLSTAVITGNVINLTLNGVVLSPITFTTSAAVTMALLAAEILLQPNISNVDISADNLTISIIPFLPNQAVINSLTVTGGVSQPVVTILASPSIIQATASVQPLKGDEVKLVPEARRDSESFKMYTSTQILPLTSQNPDQIQDFKSPFTGITFEVVELFPWQNNANFNIVNHYKYIAFKLAPLP